MRITSRGRSGDAAAALGADGITFVNAAQQLVAISSTDLNLALSAGP